MAQRPESESNKHRGGFTTAGSRQEYAPADGGIGRNLSEGGDGVRPLIARSVKSDCRARRRGRHPTLQSADWPRPDVPWRSRPGIAASQSFHPLGNWK